MNSGIKQANIGTAIHYAHTHVETERFLLSQLAGQNLLAYGTSLEEFRSRTGLADFYWETTFYQHPYHRRSLAEAMADAEGYVIFMHGWDGSHRIWEEMPVKLAVKNKKLICFNLDVNGFGQSPFIAEMPALEQCSPAGLMRTVDYWLTAIKLWPTPAYGQRPFFLFVGHSMSGAALFYKNVTNWQNEKYGFYALAPALFCNDTQKRAFFKAFGLMGTKLPQSINAIKNAMAPHVIELLGSGASQAVKDEHLRVYNHTSFGTISQVLYAMGAAVTKPNRSDWSRFRVALGHRDRVVNVNNMLDLLEELNFNANQIRVMLGDHYFFSYDPGSPVSHQRNQKILLGQLLEFCTQLAHEPTAKITSMISSTFLRQSA
ncbi:MAG TPA: alpha/beta hydrolase [Anaerolineae bacterium]|nr:alpha/beta hydrolase [Anaerolineae bacterium]